MTTMHTGTPPRELSVPPTWVRVALGVALIVAGIVVLGDIAIATLISTLFIGAVAIIVGAFEVVHAFWTKGWGGFLWQILLGVLYVAFGVVLISQPLAGALVLTLVLGLLLLISGVHPHRAERHALEGCRLDHACFRRFRRPGRPGDPDRISDVGPLGPRAGARD